MDIKNAETKSKLSTSYDRLALGLVLTFGAAGSAFAEDAVAIDLTTGLAGVAIIAGLMSAGGLKALPTYAAWGIKKALAMLR